MVSRRVDGVALRKARLNAGLTLREVAAELNVADGARIGAWEHGREQPQPSFIPLLAKALNVPVTALLLGKSLTPSLADLRLAKGLTLTEVAAKAGIARSTFHRLEQGIATRPLERTTLMALAKALDSSTDGVLTAIQRGRADHQSDLTSS